MVGCFTWILNTSLYLGQVRIYIYIFFFFPGHIFPILLVTSRFIFISFCFCWFMEILRFFLDFFAKKDWASPDPRPLPRGLRFVCQVFLNMEAPFFFGLFSMSFMDAAKKTTADIGAATSRAESRQPAVVKRPMEISRRFFGSGAWRMEETFLKTHRFIMMFCLLQLRKNMWKGLNF